MSHVIYVLNRVSTKALKTSTPYEMWTSLKPYVGHLMVFGCVTHMMVAKDYLKKLDKRSRHVVHMGNENGTCNIPKI